MEIFIAFQSLRIVPVEESNDLIENAIPIECGDEISTNTIFSTNTETLDLCGNPNSNDVWYIMNGTGEVNYFNLISGVLSNVYIEVYTQSSIGLDCIYNEIISDNVSAFFLAELDIQYYIRVYARDREAAFSLKTSCSESPNNISCETSINLSCNQIIEGTFFGATNSTVNCFPGQNQSGVWYTVIGDGNSYIINIESLDSNLNGTDNSTIYIIEEDCSMGSCSIYEPIINGELNEITFLEDIEYHIFVSNKNLFFDFVINIYCQPQNGTCENAILVSCDTPVTGYSWGLDYNVTSNCQIATI